MSEYEPCIECGEPCYVWMLQLGDVFESLYLRVCSGSCLFKLAYEYLNVICENREFRDWLAKKELPEDAKEREEYLCAVRELYQQSITNICYSFDKNLLKKDTGLAGRLFGSKENVPGKSISMKFTRISEEKLLELQKKAVAELSRRLEHEKAELERMEDLETLVRKKLPDALEPIYEEAREFFESISDFDVK